MDVALPAVRDPQRPDELFGLELSGIDPSALSVSPETAATAAAALSRTRVHSAPCRRVSATGGRRTR